MIMSHNSGNLSIFQFPADQSGCGHYRMYFPSWSMRTIVRKISITNCQPLIVNSFFYKAVRIVRIQRQMTDAQMLFILNFLIPLSKEIGFWLIYEIDDVAVYEDIPPWNSGRKVYENPKLKPNMETIMKAVDYITVTTPVLAEYYSLKFGIEKEKFIVIPNFLPRWWVGEGYNKSKISASFDQNRRRPRIGLPLSLSHYNIYGLPNTIDDFTGIRDFVRSTSNKYEWVFIGYCPPEFKDLLENKKASIVPFSDILNYPREMFYHNLSLIVAPLHDCIFNRCKSNIKLIESWALGIPAIVQNLPCYSPYTPLTFNDANDLENKINLVMQTKGKYVDLVEYQRNLVDHGDKNAPAGWWLEKNLNMWYSLYTLPQKTLKLDLSPEIEAIKNKDVIKDPTVPLNFANDISINL